MSQEEQLISFFAYSMFIYPVTNYLVSPKRNYARWKGVLYAIFFLAFISGCHIIYENREKGLNYYQTLGWTRGDSLATLKKNFKKLSLELHPDKNKSPEAVAEFRKVKQAYEVLSKTDSRRIYNLFGEEGIQKSAHAVIDHKSIIISMLVYYVSSAIFAFIMTVSEPTGDAMINSLFGLICIMFLEVILILEEHSIPIWIFPSYTSYDIVSMGKRLFPAIMNGCRCIYGSFHQDEKAIRVEKLTELSRMFEISASKLEALAKKALNHLGNKNSSNKAIESEGIVAYAIEYNNKQISSKKRDETIKYMESKVNLVKNPKLLNSSGKSSISFEFIRNIVLYLFITQIIANYSIKSDKK